MIRSCSVLTLRLRETFTTTHGSSDVRRNALLQIENEERVGLGEAAPYYDEQIDDVTRALEAGEPGASRSARAALEMANLDLEGQARGVPAWALLGARSVAPLPTSFTLGQADPTEMERRARAAAGWRILKVKVGTPHDLANLRLVRALHPEATIRADANGAWTAEEAPGRIEALAPFGLELVEQPVPPGDPEALGRVRERSPVPIFADEGIRSAEDVNRHAGSVDGVVVKLAKCGGHSAVRACIAAARAHGMRIMIGCTIETSLGITAAAHVAGLCDLVDLDGHLLIAEDPFQGALLVDGALVLPDGATGLGVFARRP
jgi:L-alanine-DL-glutamate epimerase-like enolase superfamily enzyme